MNKIIQVYPGTVIIQIEFWVYPILFLGSSRTSGLIPELELPHFPGACDACTSVEMNA